jgi:hypothetical protein
LVVGRPAAILTCLAESRTRILSRAVMDYNWPLGLSAFDFRKPHCAAIPGAPGRDVSTSQTKFPIGVPGDTLCSHARRRSPDPRQPCPGPDPLGNRGGGAARLALDATFTLLEIEWLGREIPVNHMRTPRVKIQALLSDGRRRQNMWSEGCIETPAHFVGNPSSLSD